MPHGTALEDEIHATQYLRLPAVVELVGASRSTIYSWMHDPLVGFPKPVRLGRRMVAWPRNSVEEFLAGRSQASGK